MEALRPKTTLITISTPWKMKKIPAERLPTATLLILRVFSLSKLVAFVKFDNISSTVVCQLTMLIPTDQKNAERIWKNYLLLI